MRHISQAKEDPSMRTARCAAGDRTYLNSQLFRVECSRERDQYGTTPVLRVNLSVHRHRGASATTLDLSGSYDVHKEARQMSLA